MSVSIPNNEGKDIVAFFATIRPGHNPEDNVLFLAEKHGINVGVARTVGRVLIRIQQELDTVNRYSQQKGTT